MSIRLENISKYYGPQAVVNNLSLEIDDGEFFVLLGASGSGKTTALNIIAGLIQPDKGRVLLHGRDVTDLPTQKRRVGFVFQNYALFQYMTVAQNIEFGLQVMKVPRDHRHKKRDELLELVGLVGLADRKPSQLSGGQQQRVALARALALEPDVLLLDEPLGALDTKIRVELRRRLKMIQKNLGVAAILVTHDQEEAFDLADRIGVMNYGRLIELGTPFDLYNHPKTEYVASFLGSANLLLGQINGREVFIGKQSFPLYDNPGIPHLNNRAQILFRPEDVALASNVEDLGCLPLGRGRVIEKGFSGRHESLRVELPAIEGVRSIAPAAPFGHPGFIMDVNRSPEQSTNLPINLQDEIWVGIRRLHVLSHPGLNFLIPSDGSLRSQSALSLGGYIARMSHARVVLLGIGKDREKVDLHLQDARKLLGSGMASTQVESSDGDFGEAIAESSERHNFDLLILGWRPTAGSKEITTALASGEHHLLLATRPVTRLARALICLASGEPGHDTVLFTGRLLRHLGAEATLMTVMPHQAAKAHPQSRIERFLVNGQNSLARFGVPAQTKIKQGGLVSAIQEETQQFEYDLVVLGAPLPDEEGIPDLAGHVGSVITTVENCSFLIVKSHQYQRLQNKFRRMR